MADDNEKKDEQKTNDTAEEAGEGDPCDLQQTKAVVVEAPVH